MLSQRLERDSITAMVHSLILLLPVSAAICLGGAQTDQAYSLVEQDWLMQARVSSLPAIDPISGTAPVATWADAAGAVDGKKDGKYAFHTAAEANPWWQVDLGEPRLIGRIVIYNRLDYGPGLHNADNLIISTSDDGKAWTVRHENKDKHFGGITGAAPLEVLFETDGPRARFVRLQIASNAPVYFHLDEVEIYGPDNAGENIALGRKADQSSVSQWSTAKLKAFSPGGATYPTMNAIERGRLLASDLRQKDVDVTWFKDETDEIAKRLKELGDNAADAVRGELYLRARRAVRRLVFSNPLLDFEKLLFVKRFTQETYPDVCLNHMPWVSRPGGDICIVDVPGAGREWKVANLLKGTLGPGHVHGMDLSWDGKRVVFGYAKARSNEPPAGWKDRRTNYDLRRTEEPTHLFEIGTDGRKLRQITDGEWSDLDPTYAPTGDIVFISERCGTSLQCNEYDKDETSCNLYSCRPDGSDIRQLSVSKDGDYLPHTLDDGTIGYTRWEYQERSWAYVQSIWVIHPDGTGADALFKQHLNNPWALEDVRSIPDTANSRLAAIATGHHTLAAGPVVIITPSVGMNDPRAIEIVTPGVYPPEGGMSGAPVRQGGVPDRGGYYMTPWPLSEKFFLVSYSYSNEQTDPAGYGIYLIDVYGNKELVYRDPEISCFIPIPLRSRRRPPILPDVTDRKKSHAICSVSNVGRGVTGVRSEEIRYIRISQRLQWPYDNRFGGQRYAEKAWPHNWTPVRVIGTVPVEADGSAHFQVPADTPLYFQLLDANHMELRRMRSFISFQPGERRGCVGCHETRAEAGAVASVPAALHMQPRIPTPPPWGERAVSFLRDVQPVFNRHCVGCHGGLTPKKGLDFSGGLTAQHNRAYDTILAHNLVAWSNVNDDAKITLPLTFGSHKSKLLDALRDEHHRQHVRLSRDEWLRLVTWIDANAPYHDGFINKRPENPPYDLPADNKLMEQIAAVHAKRCGSCHNPVDITRPEWIDLERTDRTLFLIAPLAKESNGTQRCTVATYIDEDDGDYKHLLELLESAVARALRYPRRDVMFLSQAN